MVLVAGCGLCTEAFAANHGRITAIAFAGAAFGPHPDVVQIKIEGGFSQGTCDATIAAVRKRDGHLISLLLAAQLAGLVIDVYLDESDRYYADRCVISLVSAEPQT